MEARVVHHSNAIEHNPLTLAQTAVIIAGHDAHDISKASDVRGALDHHEGLKHIEHQLAIAREYKQFRALDLHDVQILQKSPFRVRNRK